MKKSAVNMLYDSVFRIMVVLTSKAAFAENGYFASGYPQGFEPGSGR